MLLKLEHIAVFQANWSDKATNIEAIAKTLNIGLDSLVLLDDNPAERSQVRKALPMVAVPELPTDPSLYARTLAERGLFRNRHVFRRGSSARRRSIRPMPSVRSCQRSRATWKNFWRRSSMTIEFHAFDAGQSGGGSRSSSTRPISSI